MARSSSRFATFPGLAGLALLLAAGSVHAQDRASQCAADSEEGQTLRDKNQYRAARSKFRSCAQSSCPNVVRKDCTKWLSELEEALPTIVVAAVDDHGMDVVDVELAIDGESVGKKLDGTPIAIDPGSHQLRASATGHEPTTLPIVARVGDKNRIVRITLPKPKGSTPTPTGTATPSTTPDTSTSTNTSATSTPKRPSHAPPLSSIVLGGVGAAALVSFAVFGITAQSDFGKLKDTCGPSCPDDSTSGIKTRMLVADISLGVGIAALGTAAVLWIIHKPEPAKSAAIRFRFGAAPTVGGAAASFGAAF